MSASPTLVFVHGGWHSAHAWDKVTTILKKKDLKCVCVNLPSAAGVPTATILDDIETVRDAISAETTQGRDVVVVTHSFGSIVGSSAVKGFAAPKQGETQSDESGATGHVIGLAMIATGFVATGASFLDTLGGIPPPIWKEEPGSPYLVWTVDVRLLLYQDLPEEEGHYWVTQLGKQTAKAFNEGGQYTYAGWKDVPVWALGTVLDQGLPIAAQRQFVQDANDAGANVVMREIEASHSPMLSKPDDTAAILVEAVAAFTGQK